MGIIWTITTIAWLICSAIWINTRNTWIKAEDPTMARTAAIAAALSFAAAIANGAVALHYLGVIA